MADPPGRELPPFIAFLRCIAKAYLVTFKRFRSFDAGYVPQIGPVILVANHATAYDPVCLQVACKRRLIRFMQAREYYEKRPIHYFYKMLKVIPVNRNGNDTAGIRTALRALSDGGCLGIYPEGKISETGELRQGHKGVVLLAIMSRATVIPSYLHSTRPYRGMVRDFFLINRVTLCFGPPVPLDDLAGRHRDHAALDMGLKRIMGAIQALHDRYATASPSAPSESA